MHRQQLRELQVDDAELARRARLHDDAERVAGMGSWEWVIATGRTTWSDETFRILGYVRGDVLPSFDAFMARVIPEDRERARFAVERVVDLAKGEVLELELVKPDGAVCEACIRMEVIGDDTGKPVRLVGVVQDVTARNAALAASAAAARVQATLVSQLEEVNRELGEFAYIVSHDLKAPLRGIGSLADWLARDQRERLDDDGKEQLDLLLGRVKRMDALIDGILRYSRIGRAKEEVATVDLTQLTADVIDLIAAPDHVRVVVETSMPTVRGARTQLAQVFQNLIGNAVKFCDKADGEVRVSCVDDGQSHRFEVADNGPGIDARHHQRIFQIFQTLSPRDKTEGTGIGLSIVKKIIETMGGRIWVKSSVGSGCRFFFTIPKATEVTS